MPLPLTITVGAKGDTITIPANHGFNYVKLGGTGFDGNTSVYKYRLRNNFSPITITFRDATNGEDQACSPYFPSYTPESAWIPIIDGVEIYQSNRLSYVSGQNYGPGPFGYCAAGTAFGSLTFFTGIPRVMVRTNLRMPPIIPTDASRQVSSSATSLPPGYRRISLRPQQPVRTNLRVAAAASPPVKTTGTVNSPPTLSAPVIVTPTQVTTTTTTRATTTLCEPFSFVASNIGPWSQSRPGYVCSGTSYGNGTYAWALTASTRTGNTWVGPNMPRFSFDGVDDNGLEIWTFSANGWAECQVPTYTDTQTKSRTSNSITFNIGAGTLVITFTGCGSNGAGITTTTTTTTQLLASGVYDVSTSATSGVLTSMLATGLASTGWATSGSIITNYYITSGDIYDVDMLSSPGLFTPLPTITGVADLTVGQPFIITGINCSEIRNLLFITGENRLKSNKREISIIANQDYQFLSKAGEETSYLEYFRYVGKMGFDLIEVIGNLPDSAKTGNFIITGVANDTFIGTGQVFLISKHDSNQTTYDFNYFSDIKNFSSAYPDLYTTNSLSRVISSAHISITGQNNIIAESIKFSEASGLILPGKYLQDITGIFLSGGAYDLSSGVFIKITQSSDVYLEDYLYGLITGTPQGLIANKSFYEDSHHVNLNSVINNYFYLFSDPSNASLSGVPFYDDYLRYYSGQITLLSPYYEIVL